LKKNANNCGGGGNWENIDICGQVNGRVGVCKGLRIQQSWAKTMGQGEREDNEDDHVETA